MHRFLSAVETTAAVFLLLIALLTASNVLLRDLFSIQIPDWFDGTKLLQGVALFWGIALASYRGSHICVDVVWEQLRAPGRRLMDLFATVVTLAFLAPLAWMVWVKVGRTGTQATMDLRLPMTNFYAVAAVGASVAVVLAAWRLVELWRDHGRAGQSGMVKGHDGP
ncbi:MAG: TRAP transporter small permease [Rubrivivax sp.]|nr:TRAP transporter small permease [Rubrivivax sp.]MDP1646717.1 TRAP transporter small permease [Rubrivivax sp.]